MTTATMPAAVTTEKAGWWTRFGAAFIDFVGLGIINAALTSILYAGDTTASSGLQTLLGVVYFVYFWSSYGKGQTVGMRALKIKVIKTDGSQLDLVGAFLRYIGLVISCIALFIGVIWAAFDANKQGWHDKIANTYVVKA